MKLEAWVSGLLISRDSNIKNAIQTCFHTRDASQAASTAYEHGFVDARASRPEKTAIPQALPAVQHAARRDLWVLYGTAYAAPIPALSAARDRRSLRQRPPSKWEVQGMPGARSTPRSRAR